MGSHHFVIHSYNWRLVISGWFEVRIELVSLLDELVSIFLQLLPGTIFSGGQPLTLIVVDWLRGWRPVLRIRWDS